MEENETVYRMAQREDGTWYLAENPVHISREDMLQEKDLASPTRGRVKYRRKDGSVAFINATFEHMEPAEAGVGVYLRASDLDQL